MTDPAARQTIQTLPVYPAAVFVVTEGVAEGDPISFADDLVMDDIYQLSRDAARGRLSLAVLPDGAGRLAVAQGSEMGVAGNTVHLDCCLTLMAPDGGTIETLVLVEVEDDAAAEVYLLPLASLLPEKNYRLVGIDRHAATTRFAEVACVSFTRGTHITMASGAQVRIEDLRVGDKVLTRDDGAQPIRWIGQNVLRAVGAFAPVMIRKGTLHNENDLVLSSDHRIFVYQRQDRLGAGRPEVLVKVRHLINGTTVVQLDGGFVEYFQLLFDDHQIIFAEGIAAESLLIDPRTRAAVPSGMRGTQHSYRPHLAYEVQETLLAAPDTVELLRRASSET
ncbi:MAG: Hint domain-containing protein [Rubellimicrobium sp.]|nr:Hint domain-containing protein [Rubellimicrobium sp.]